MMYAGISLHPVTLSYVHYIMHSLSLSMIEALAVLGANRIELNDSPPAGRWISPKKVSMASSISSFSIDTDTC